MKLTKERVKELRALIEKATPGPWYRGNISDYGADRDNDTVDVACPSSDSGLKRWPVCEIYGGVGYNPENAALIAASRTALADALDDREELERALEEARGVLESVRGAIKEITG